MIADEFIKLCGLKERALGAVQRIGRYSKGAVGDEEGLTGLNRIRQKLKGDLAKKYYDQYSAMPAGPEKEQMMRRLVDEDTSVLNSRINAGAAAGLAGTGLVYGVNQGLGKLVNMGAGAVRRGLSESDDDTGINNNDDEFTRAQKQYNNIENSIGGKGGKAVREVLERFGNSSASNKLTYGDTVPVPTQAAMAAGVLGLTGKTMAANLLGAQTFYHGTPKENVDNILRTGIDPSYGGIEGGGAWRISQKGQAAKEMNNIVSSSSSWPYDENYLGKEQHRKLIDQYGEKLKGVLMPGEHKEFMGHDRLQRAADHISPKMKLMGTGTEIPMDTTDFLANAKGNSFVAKGFPGRIAATTYGRMIDPKSTETLNKLYGESSKKFGPMIDNLTNSHPVSRFGKMLGYVLGKAPIDMITEGKKYYDGLVTPTDTNVVGGVLPQEQFDSQFIRDPDDVTRMQTGYKTQTKIDPKNLARNEVSLGQIFKNRSRQYGKYLKGNKGKVLSGLGLMGLNGAMSGLAGHSIYTTGKKILGKNERKMTSE
jgi:hypothetical protein